MKKKGRVLQVVFHDFYAKENGRAQLTLRAKTEEIVEEWISILQATMAAGTAVNHLAAKFQSQTSVRMHALRKCLYRYFTASRFSDPWRQIGLVCLWIVLVFTWHRFLSQAIANSISDRMAASIDNYANKMMTSGHRFSNVDELISHQFSRALKILKSIMDTTQGKAVLELEAIRLKETTDICQEDLQ